MAIDEIYTRASVRAYEKRPVEEEKVKALLKAAMSAPSAGNKQPWAFVVVTEAERLKALSEVLPYGGMIKEAPLAIAVCGDMTRAFAGDEQDFWVQDASAATENILLAARSLGLGAVWTGVYPMKDRAAGVARILELPEQAVPLNVLPVGYPQREPHVIDKWDEKKIHREKW